MMNPEIKEKWLTALRSGEYKQGAGQLFYKDSDGVKRYCCLGVLCDVLIKDGELADWRENGESSYGIPISADLSFLEAGVAPDAALGVSGFSSPTGRLSERVGNYGTLTMLNDSGEFTFDQIADVIEEQF